MTLLARLGAPSGVAGWLLLLALCLAATPLQAQESVGDELPSIDEIRAGYAEMQKKLDAVAESAVELDADGGIANNSLYSDMNTLWTCLAAFMVFFMQAGFALVEVGLTRAKNACNILMKNVMDLVIGSLSYWVVGFGLMFGAASLGGMIGTSNFFFEADSGFNWAFFLFQTVFCATAATIVSGAMAERTKFGIYLIISAVLCAFIYPVFAGWAWHSLYGQGDGALEAGGWLAAIFGGADVGFVDFAGSTVVHSVGGWAALAGALIIGPRLGKYKNGKINPIPGHNMVLAGLGVFILWLGWFGFNPGSTTAVGKGDFAAIAVTTNLSAAAGALSAMLASWLLFKKPDPSFTLNGALAGLVGITAGCANMTPTFSIVTGLVAGVIVVGSCVLFDKIKIDDPVGAISVHGVCGAWGTLAVGLFEKDGAGLFTGGGVTLLLVQITGVVAAFIWAFGLSALLFLALKYTVGLRVSEVEEIEGLDMHEHGILAYPTPLVIDPMAGGAIHSPSPGLAFANTAKEPVPAGSV